MLLATELAASDMVDALKANRISISLVKLINDFIVRSL